MFWSEPVGDINSCFENFKTSRSYGDQTIPFSDQLSAVMDKSFQNIPSEVLGVLAPAPGPWHVLEYG